MSVDNAQRARILVHALPYIQEYTGKIVVVKYGGNAMQSESLKDSVMRDVILLSLIGVKVVLVHGGGPEITDMLNRVGKETVFGRAVGEDFDLLVQFKGFRGKYAHDVANEAGMK